MGLNVSVFFGIFLTLSFAFLPGVVLSPHTSHAEVRLLLPVCRLPIGACKRCCGRFTSSGRVTIDGATASSDAEADSDAVEETREVVGAEFATRFFAAGQVR